MKVVFLSLFFAFLISHSARASEYTKLISDYYTLSKNPVGITTLDRQKAVESKVRSLNLAQEDVPAETYRWTLAKVEELSSTNGFAWVGPTELPMHSAYEKGPPSKWVSFLAEHMSDPQKFHCTGFLGLGFGCGDAEKEGIALDPLVGGVAYYVARDKNLEPSDLEKLKNTLHSFYKDLSVETNPLDWQLRPGAMLQWGATLKDPRATQTALKLIRAYLEESSHNSYALSNFQDAIFALNSYCGSASDPTTKEISALLERVRSSDRVEAFLKAKIKTDSCPTSSSRASNSVESGSKPSTESHGQSAQ